MPILMGASLILVGIAWRWVRKLPLGRLRGDIIIDRPGIFFPPTAMILVSLLLSLIGLVSR